MDILAVKTVLKKIIAWPLMWLTYWCGHLTSKIMNNFSAPVTYPIYNKLMWWSSDLQGWAKLNGPWNKP